MNWITVVAPQWLGMPVRVADPAKVLYWGFGYVWEASAFIGLTTAVFVVASLGKIRRRTVWPLVILLILTAVLAMGQFTPLYPLLYKYVPLFDDMRGTSKFAYLTVLAAVVLAGHGFDDMQHASRWAIKLPIVVG